MPKTVTPIPHSHYRPDIDGLRALAILLVIIFHAFPKFLRGGFIGVDIFFVISGYLITGIIIKEQQQGCFSLLHFYSRRIQRIFPSLIVVLIFCLVVGWFILLPNEYETLGKHIAAGSIYISNFILQSESGYFDTQAEYKPLLHLWSLSIEEQFYCFFPLLLILCQRFRLNPLYSILTCLIISFFLNIANIKSHPTQVFFYPHTRAWELLIGSAVSCLKTYYAENTVSIIKKYFSTYNIKFFANIVSWFGLILIIFAWYTFDSKKILFPSGWALIPTIGASCLIIAGQNTWFNSRILSNKIAVSIGLISYPLYLWHWVLLSFIHITEIDAPNVRLKITIIVISIFLAWISYYFVERKIRFQKNKILSTALLITLLFIGYLGRCIQQHKINAINYKDNTSVNNALSTKKPVLSTQCHAKFPHADFCQIQHSENLPTALLVGDSHANQLYDGLITKTNVTGGNLLNLAVGDCFPFFDNPDYFNKNCRPLINQALEMAISIASIKTIILASRALTELNQQSFIAKKQLSHYVNIHPHTLIDSDPYVIFQKGMRNTLQRLTKTDKTIIFVLDTPDLEFEPTACINRPWRLSGLATKIPCAISRSRVTHRRQKYLTIIRQVLNEFPSVKVWDTLPSLCDDNYCWASKEGQILYHDSNHLNTAGAVYVSKQFTLEY